MSHVTYRIVRHDDGWAYTVNGVFSEPFPTHDAALAAARTGTQRGSNTRTRKGAGIPRRPPAAIVRTPTSKTRIDRRANPLRSSDFVVNARALAYFFSPGSVRRDEARHGLRPRLPYIRTDCGRSITVYSIVMR